MVRSNNLGEQDPSHFVRLPQAIQTTHGKKLKKKCCKKYKKGKRCKKCPCFDL